MSEHGSKGRIGVDASSGVGGTQEETKMSIVKSSKKTNSEQTGQIQKCWQNDLARESGHLFYEESTNEYSWICSSYNLGSRY